jgi:NADP-reducing hydrogenase subunit HndB
MELIMKSLEELRAIKEKMKTQMGIRSDSQAKTRIVVGMATCGIAAGARPVLAAITEEVAKRKLTDVAVIQTGCIGICQYEPVVEVYKENEEKITYVKMTPQMAIRIINDHIVNGNVVTEYTIGAAVK